MISIIDYGRGNLFSIGQGLRHLGRDYQIVDDPKRLKQAGQIILPGVGAFGDAMQGLGKLGLIEPLQRQAEAGVAIIGICLGMQLLVSQSSEFGTHDGLNLIPGTVGRLDGDPTLRIPNVGWRTLTTKPEHQNLLISVDDPVVYFTHSYFVSLQDRRHQISEIAYGKHQIAAIIGKDNIIGLQFHPEKSGLVGLKILDAVISTLS